MAISLDQYVQNLIRAGLFTAEELAAFQQNLPPDHRPREPKDLARELIQAGKLTKYQAARVFQGKTKGLVLGDYVIQDEIGHGGMGQVFKARHRTMKRVVALKQLPAKAMQSRDAVQRFRREVEAAAKLEHPNVVTAYDAGEAEGVHFLVMQYVDGRDLAHVLMERGPLPVAEAIDYTIQAAKGLEYAHRRGIVHRDIKPGNLLLDQEGTVKILDMGLARIDQPPDPRAQTAPEALTESGQVMGTYDYMAPEQAQDTHGADHRADIYSLGCTLFRLLTGDKPFHGDTPVATLLAHCQAPIPSLRAVRDEVSPELETVVQKMLAKDPAERQQSMGEVISELEGCIRPATPPVPEPPMPPPVEQTATSSSSSDSALKAFLRRLSGEAVAAQPKPMVSVEETRQLQRERETSVLAGRRAPSQAARKKTLLWLGIGGGIVAVVLILAVGFALFGRSGPEQDKGREVAQVERKKEKPNETARPTTGQAETWLLIQWPEPERADAKLEIDGRPVELAGADIQPDQEHLRIPTEPGSHRIWIARRGFAPYEVQVAISEGQSLEITPEWQTAPRLVAETERGPEQAAAEPGAQPTMPKPSQVAEEPPPTQPELETPKPEVPKLDPEEEKRLAAEQRYTEALAPAEELVAAWKFRDALAELGKVKYEEEDFAARLASRREQVGQLAQLKSRIIDKLNKAAPPVTKADLKIRGVGGDIVKADEECITAQLRTKTETRAWNDLGEQSTEPLLGLVIDSKKPEDLLAAGLLAMACKNTSLAEGYFEQARQLGVDIGPYLVPLAATAFARATQALQAGEFREAEALLANVEAKYGDTTWFTANRATIEAARERTRAGQEAVTEARAEEVFTEAVRLFKDKEFFDLKPIVEKLKADYPETGPVNDSTREPSFAEMEEAVASLGEFVTVRLDGKGDFTSIQEAIDAARPHSLIQVEDDGPYAERLVFPDEKPRLRVRGKKGCCPVITSLGLTMPVPLVEVKGSGIALERLVLLHAAPTLAKGCLVVRTGGLRLVSSAVLSPDHTGLIRGTVTCEFEDSLLLVPVTVPMGASMVSRNCVVLGRLLDLDAGCEFQSCTLLGSARCNQSSVFRDSIITAIQDIDVRRPWRHTVETCNVIGQAVPENAKGCLSADPQFRDPANLDYRLMPTSPCIGKASDGGDIGCRYTPEMIEMVQKALELRARGIIKF